MTTYAAIHHHRAFLFTDYGYALAVAKFGQTAVDALPKFGPRSKHVGKPKGIVTFRKVSRGGWVRLEGRVENRVGSIITAELRELAAFGRDPESGAAVASWDAERGVVWLGFLGRVDGGLQLGA
jgi:hypothetical protein